VGNGHNAQGIAYYEELLDLPFLGADFFDDIVALARERNLGIQIPARTLLGSRSFV
jgi:hypothetical protein